MYGIYRPPVLSLLATLLTMACANANAAERGVVVIIIEPRSGEPGYAFSIDNTAIDTNKELLDKLDERFSKDQRLAVLVHEGVPIRALGHVGLAASKAGFGDPSIAYFVFPKDRQTMVRLVLPGDPARQVEFSADPAVLSALIPLGPTAK